MRNKIYFFLLAAFIFSCDEETKPVDPIYEFIAFKGPSVVNLNELVNSAHPVPLVLELKAFHPYTDDIDIAFEITPTNAEQNTDFVVSAESVKLRAGKLVSDTVFVSSIDNDRGSALERSFQISIKSVSKENIKIGLGITEPKNAAITVRILDDECANTIAVFNSADLVNTLDWGGGDVAKPASGVVTADKVKITGDLIDYGAFSNASLTITLAPESEGSTKGSATFGEQETGTDSDGYDYKFVQTGDGTFDVCSGTISVAYDIYYMDGDWIYWYSVTNVFSVP